MELILTLILGLVLFIAVLMIWRNTSRMVDLLSAIYKDSNRSNPR